MDLGGGAACNTGGGSGRCADHGAGRGGLVLQWAREKIIQVQWFTA